MTGKALNTEEKIKEAARKIFTEKGFAATRTRDIADEAGINIALLNYYFRSKENLFQIIMFENLQLFIQDVLGILNNEATTLHQKVDVLAEHYIDMLLNNPGLPVFVLNTINSNPAALLEGINGLTNAQPTVLSRQWQQWAGGGQFAFNPLHILFNVVGLTVFPFAASPAIKLKLSLSDEQFKSLMEERKRLIPMWVKGMLEGLILRK